MRGLQNAFFVDFLIFPGKWLYKYLLCRNWSIQLEVWIMAIPVLRNTVGARNPFAFAEAKLGKTIDWRNVSAGEKKRIIENAFGAPYHEVFNDSKKDTRYLHPVLSGSGDAVQCNAATVKNLIKSWGKNPYGTTYSDTPYGYYEDPVQGALSDCFFVAALVSIANASRTKTKFPNLGGSSFGITFYGDYKVDAATGVNTYGSSKQVTVTNDHFPQQGNGNLVFGRSNTTAEIWPAIYEKGYAEWKSGGTMTEPDYSLLCLGNPITALANLTGYKYNTGGTATPTAYETTKFAGNPNQILDTLVNQKAVLASPNGTDYFAQWPTVAYTYDSDALGYSNAAIVRNHSYSVLGAQKTATGKYIILRNPWGQVPPPVYVDPKILDANRCILDASGNPIICYGDQNLSGLGSDVVSQNTWMGKSLTDVNDGIFGLNAVAFQKYFQGFGWVYA